MATNTDPAWARCTMLSAGWRTARELATMSDGDVRNTLIVELSRRCSDGTTALQGKSTQALSEHAMISLWLVEASVRTAAQLAQMSLNDQRNTTISELCKQAGATVSVLQAMNNFDLLVEAHKWWLPRRYATVRSALGAIQSGSPRFHVEDDAPVSMDVLKVIQVQGSSGAEYYGVYHHSSTQNGKSDFELYLAHSTDLIAWKRVKSLGFGNHQGELCPVFNGSYLLLNECSGVPNRVRFRLYDSLQALTENTPSRDYLAPANLSSTQAEGTPSIREVTGTSADSCVILIGQHYMTRVMGADTDRLAIGVLINFSEYHSWVDLVANEAIARIGYAGKIGGRDRFVWKGMELFVQEAQLVNGDWSTWRILLGNGRFYTNLSLDTGDAADTSFANPKVATLPGGKFVVTLLMPTEGNGAANRAGTLLYTLDSTTA